MSNLSKSILCGWLGIASGMVVNTSPRPIFFFTFLKVYLIYSSAPDLKLSEYSSSNIGRITLFLINDRLECCVVSAINKRCRS